MKKLLLMLGSLLLVSGVAYGKEIVAPVEVVTETVYVVVTPKSVTNIYGKIGLDVWSEYDERNIDMTKATNGETDRLGFEIALEVTRNIRNNFEMGVGIAYQRHSDFDSYSSFYDIKFDQDRYDSIPVYVVGKYNFEPYNNGISLYLKGNIGISFNFDKGDLEAEDNTGKYLGKYNLDLDNGLYFGLGGGVEYKNFFMDLMYQVNKANVDISPEGHSEIKYKSDSDYSRVTLGFGYKFSY